MKTVRLISLLVVCGLALAGSAFAAATAPASRAQEIAAQPELVVGDIRNLNAEDSAAIVAGALDAILASDWPEAKKREHGIALITYAVAYKGKEAAPMMGIVASRVPPAGLPLIAATAVLAAGDNSPAVANAMLEAVAANAPAAVACRAACDNPATVLSPTEIGIARGITLPTPSPAPTKATKGLLLPALKYQGQ